MAKPYREAALTKVDEGAGLPLQDQRVDKATELLGRMIARFDEDFVIDVATEIGLDECILFNDEAQISFDLTSLQLVALASTLAACAEFRDGANTVKAARKKKRTYA